MDTSDFPTTWWSAASVNVSASAFVWIAMPAYSPTIPVRYTALLWECMESLDADRRRCGRGRRPVGGALDYPDTSMTLAELAALLEEVERSHRPSRSRL